jgi:hypothetical protein
MRPTTNFPTALADDADDVTYALNVAHVLWDKGDRSDAIRWVRRAVEAADESGHTARVVALARAASDLEDAPAAEPMRAEPLRAEPMRAEPRPAEPRPAEPRPALSSFTRTTSGPRPAPESATRQAAAALSQPAPAGVRVSVKYSLRDPTLLVVRRLAEGQTPPAGTREALLVMSEAPGAEAPQQSRRGGR